MKPLHRELIQVGAIITGGAILLTVLCGCRVPTKTPEPQKGGTATIEIPPPLAMVEYVDAGFTNTPPPTAQIGELPTVKPVRFTLQQGENQEAPTSITYTRETSSDAGEVTKETFKIVQGEHQHDTLRDMWAGVISSLEKYKAKLASYGTTRIGGFVLICIGIAGIAVPYLRAIIGTTGSFWAIGLGLFMIFGSHLMAGNEKLILGGSVAVLLLWIVARKHGVLQGTVDSNSSNVVGKILERVSGKGGL